MAEVKLMKGNEAVAEAAIRAGCDAYFGYPITPQSEVIEYLMMERPEERTGMVCLQAESEIAAIHMVYGAAGAGKKVMTSSSSPGISLKLEGISYIAGAELPAVIVNVVRGGPGLGTIQPSQADYFQATKGGGHGDYRMLVLAPASVQEMADFVADAFELAFKYRNPILILSDGVIGQMMEKVIMPEQTPRMTDEEIKDKYGDWATIGKPETRERNIITSLELDPFKQEAHNIKLQAKYQQMCENEVRYEMINCEDAEYVFVAYGSSARIAQKAMEQARAKGIKAGIFRLITLYPFPMKELNKLADQVKGFLAVEMSAGQMIEDVKLAIEGKAKAEHFGRYGGIIHSPEEILEALETQIIGG
ncbi:MULTISPECIES: 3-methyl-2-oxobutanoate dehydrogenase subunit VorB [unclassified Lentimicrobium]|uniref:3-methyl-2-oxobutanoate dehydrogenase subunit VorB n=1 Tax=unclassified Lentimicrobium TaxID=2677434 RepID=UPI001553172C|nr:MULTISPECIES: 3-methyl-2-oxobutanoate dehydrogenase subunit VorB [unclassified Lentimicrobium]NPD45486.1 3-methyl-2-oxobutanoate dehydrogenase subunit VorB [Lentimicrobium sp. S6]NPD83996.1 3-methyl-2-oxobutanoate dehydrogenase subunit VorB [Lentimicrobium sp. L6]